MIRTLCALLALSILAGCSGRDTPQEDASLLNRLPRKEAVIKIDGHEVSGAWLRNWCVTEYRRLELASKGMPIEIDEYSLIEGGMDMIGKMYVLALEAERRGITVTDAEVQAVLAREAQRFESTAAFHEQLEKSGLSVEERKHQIRIDLLFNKYREQVVMPEVRSRLATDATAREYYEKHPDLFKVPRELHLLHMVRTVAKDATLEQKAKDRAALEQARQRVVAGETFEDIAREVSTEATAMKGGDVGWVSENTPIQARLKPAVLALKAGEMTPVLEGETAWHLFKAVGVRDARVRTFDESKAEIKERLLEYGLKLEMERTAARLRAQLIAEKKYQILDLKQVLGEPPSRPAAAPPAEPAAAAPDSAPAAS